MFVCRDILGTYYLLSDFKQQCYDDQWYNFLYFAIPAVSCCSLFKPEAEFDA